MADDSTSPNVHQGAAGAFLPFSIANFKKLFDHSESRKYMSDMEVEQVRAAVEEKDVTLLGKLYEILLLEQATGQEIIRDFVTTKNRIVGGFMGEAKGIEKKFAEAPFKKKVAAEEKSEQTSAEEMLKRI